MKTHTSRNGLVRIAALLAVLLPAGAVQAQAWRLIGISGQQTDGTDNGQGGFLYPDHTLFEINQSTGAVTKLFQTTWVNDSQAIGYCPADGLLYHMAGSESYSNNPTRTGHDQGGPDISGVGYQDSQYMEKINMTTQVATGVFNCCPCPNPDPALPCFGLAAPRPDWVRPVDRRDSTQTDQSFRERGIDEYHAARGMAWSASRNVFYITDEQGVFKMTTAGACTLLAFPAFLADGSVDNCKGIAFVTVADATKLFVGHRNGSGDNGYMMELNPETGEVIGEVPLTYPTGGADPAGQFGGLLGIAQHPVTGVIYGIRKTASNFARELVTINPATGATTLVGTMSMHMAAITFIPAAVAAPIRFESITRTGNNLTMTWSGGTPPYQLQSNPALSTGPWGNVGAPTNGLSATVGIIDPRGFFRVQGQ